MLLARAIALAHCESLSISTLSISTLLEYYEEQSASLKLPTHEEAIYYTGSGHGCALTRCTGLSALGSRATLMLLPKMANTMSFVLQLTKQKGIEGSWP